MSVETLIKNTVENSCKIKYETVKILTPEIIKAANIIAEVFKNNNKLLLCGNGGSAADCQHIAGELVGRFKKERNALPAIALTTNTSILTCIGNDYGFDDIFARQVEAHAHSGDALIGISTSGKSPNVIKAINKSLERNCKVIFLCGEKCDDTLRTKIDVVLNVPSSDTPRIQETHILIGHIICELIEHICFP